MVKFARWLLLPLVFASSAPAAADLSRDIRAAGLGEYEQAGRAVGLSLRRNFVALSNSAGESEFAQRFDALYERKVRPGLLEKLSIKPRRNRVASFGDVVRKTVALRRNHAKSFRGDPQARERIQHVFMGVLHVLDVEIRTESGANLEEFARMRRYLLTRGTFVSRGAGRLSVDDLWWDWMWLRGHDYASDLVELHLQKIQAISKTASSRWRDRLRMHAVSTSLLALRRGTKPVLAREKPAAATARLANATLELAGPTAPVTLTKELKVHAFRALQSTGRKLEAERVKKELAVDLLLAKGWQAIEVPARAWNQKGAGFLSRAWASLGAFFGNLFSFISYGAGFLLLATQLELLLIAVSIVILSKQGERHFHRGPKTLVALWKEHDLLAREGWKRVPSFLAAIARTGAEKLELAWRMFVASYTTPEASMPAKFAASMLLFSIGLQFYSAKSMVDTIVSQL